MASSLRSDGTSSRAAWSRRKNKLQVADSHGIALDSLQASLGQQGNEVVEIHIAVVVKMIKKAFLPLCGSREVNGQHSSAGLQNPSHLVSTLLARFVGSLSSPRTIHSQNACSILSGLSHERIRPAIDRGLEHHLVIRVPGLRPPLKMNFDRLDQRG
jgi:hypothetical protein